VRSKRNGGTVDGTRSDDRKSGKLSHSKHDSPADTGDHTPLRQAER
jgi:hypothetical protein